MEFKISILTYLLYGQEYTHNSSNMMYNVFAKVLLKHPDKVEGLENQKGMYFVSKIDYTDPANRNAQMPSYYKSCRYFKIGTGLSIGAAVPFSEKMRGIATLIDLCGEDRDIFQSKDVELPSPSKPNGKTYTYSLYGQEYTHNLSNMMYNVFAKVLLKHPDKVEGLENQKGMYFVSKIDYTDPANRNAQMPPYYKSCRYFKIGTGLSVGVAGGNKIQDIAALIDLCGEDRDIFHSKDVELPSPGKPGRKKHQKKDFLTY